MTATLNAPAYLQPATIEGALAALGDSADRRCVLVAGGTWVMRAALRGEAGDRTFVSLTGIDALHGIAAEHTGLRIGPMVTHAALGHALDAFPAFGALGVAASVSANPAVRNSATVGGNICAQDFTAPDLVPALIALNATVSLRSDSGEETCALADYVQGRPERSAREILTGIHVPRQAGLSAHARGLMRQAGEYPVAIVSVYAEIGASGKIGSIRIAISSVEAAPRRWESLEQALLGQNHDPATAKEAAEAHLSSLKPRDGVDAPGWYRARILPRLIERAFADLATQMGQGN